MIKSLFSGKTNFRKVAPKKLPRPNSAVDITGDRDHFSLAGQGGKSSSRGDPLRKLRKKVKRVWVDDNKVMRSAVKRLKKKMASK